MFFTQNSAFWEVDVPSPLPPVIPAKHAGSFKMNRRKLLLIVPFIGLAVLLGGVSLIRNRETMLFGALVTALGNGLIVFAFVGYITRRKITDACFDVPAIESTEGLVTVPRAFANRPFYSYSTRRSRVRSTSRRIELSPSLSLDHPRDSGISRSRSQSARQYGRRGFSSGRRSQTFSVASRDLLAAIENGTVRLASSSSTLRSLHDQPPPSYESVCSPDAKWPPQISGDNQLQSAINSRGLESVECSVDVGTDTSYDVFDETVVVSHDIQELRHHDKSYLYSPIQFSRKIVKRDKTGSHDKKYRSHAGDDGKLRLSRDSENSASGIENQCSDQSDPNVERTCRTITSPTNADHVADPVRDQNSPAADLPSYESVKHIRPTSE